jgi:hypothetical protein
MNITTILVTSVFLLVIFILPFLSSHFRKNKNLIFIYYFVVLLYQIVAFTNAFWFRTIGADMDANSFHVLAVDISNSGIFQFESSASLYKNIVGLLYWLTQPSHIIGEQLSILSISISMIVLANIIDLFKLNKFQTPIVLVYAAQPTMVTLGALTLREPIQIFLLITSVYFGLKMKISPDKKLINFFFMILFAFIAGLFHQTLFLYCSVLIFIFLIWDINKSNNIFIIKKSRMVILFITPILLAVLFYVAGNSDVSGAKLFRMVTSFEILDAISRHRAATPIGRASYGLLFDWSSIISLLYSSLIIYLNYLFTPFIWQVSTVSDFYAFLEAIAHMILIYYSIKLWILEKGQTHRLLGMMLILFFVLTLMWAFGTTNYGTGMRHKMTSWWMLALMGTPLFYSRIMAFVSRIQSK